MLNNPAKRLMALVAIGLLGWLGSSQSQPNRAQAQTGDLWLTYVSLGDSYSALVPGSQLVGRCQRSTDAWPQWVATVAAWSLSNLACSGAHTYDLTRRYRGQAAQVAAAVAKKPDVVTLTIGGNDLDFGGTIYHCYTLDCSSHKWYLRKLDGVNALGVRLVALFSRLRLALPNARIAAVGYPYLFPPHHVDNHRCGWLEPREQQNLNSLTAALDRMEAEAAAQAGIEYVSTLPVLAGHELCTARAWAYPVGRWPFYKDGHILWMGQHAIADEVLRHIG